MGLLGLTLPMVIGISASILASIIETWFLGRVGTSELAAFSFTFPVTGALTSLSFGVSIGLSSVLARTVGEGDQGQIRRLTTDGIYLAMVIMVAVGIVGYHTIDALFTLMGASGEILELIREYMQVWYMGLVFIAGPYVGSNALRATGDARVSGTIMVAGSILNVLLDPIFIFGWWLIEPMGLKGAALALVLSRFALFVATFYVLLNRVRLLDTSIPRLRIVWQSWKQIMVVSIPATATQLISPVSTAIIISLLASYGDEAVAGFGIASRIEGLFVIPLFALSASIGPYSGQNWGARQFLRANSAMNISFLFSLCWGGAVAALLMLFAPALTGLFDDHHAVTDIADTYLFMVPISYGAWGVLMMSSAVFNALGKPVRSTILSVTRMFVVYVPLAVMLEIPYGYKGIFAAACTSNILMGVTGYLWNRSTWRPVH
jgi:putative MATE family efflux protein|tara:strand:+ start:1288 stop:2586 length:1299 start_codon:yes stop_codon:yes gene_type:complete